MPFSVGRHEMSLYQKYYCSCKKTKRRFFRDNSAFFFFPPQACCQQQVQSAVRCHLLSQDDSVDTIGMERELTRFDKTFQKNTKTIGVPATCEGEKYTLVTLFYGPEAMRGGGRSIVTSSRGVTACSCRTSLPCTSEGDTDLP